jgi:hypothetical protein
VPHPSQHHREGWDAQTLPTKLFQLQLQLQLLLRFQLLLQLQFSLPLSRSYYVVIPTLSVVEWRRTPAFAFAVIVAFRFPTIPTQHVNHI